MFFIIASVEHSLPVTFIEHDIESDFRFHTEQATVFRFITGQFIMTELIVDDKPMKCAYSMPGPIWDEELEFYSIIIQDEALTRATLDTAEMTYKLGYIPVCYHWGVTRGNPL